MVIEVMNKLIFLSLIFFSVFSFTQPKELRGKLETDKYVICADNDTTKLVRCVNIVLQAGYKLYGTPFRGVTGSGNFGKGITYQALVRIK